MSLVADYPDSAPHVATATQIAGTGVPLLAKQAQLYLDLLRSVPAGGNYPEPVINLTQVGWTAQFFIQYPSAATIPFIQAVFLWTDQGSGEAVDTDTFILPGATAGVSFQVQCAGPAKSNQVQLTFNNLDPAQIAIVGVLMNQDSIVRDRVTAHWRNSVDNGLTVPTFSVATLPADESVLGVLDAVTVSSSSTDSFLFGMAPGQLVQLAGNTAGVTPSNVTVTAFARPSSVYGAGGILLRETLATAAFNYSFVAPRCPIELDIANAATSGTLTLSGMMTAQTP